MKTMIGIAIFVYCYTVQAQNLECHPKVDAKLNQYIIGYGSLIQEHSKRKSNPLVGENVPIDVHGFKRGWFHHGHPPNYPMTYLGVVPDPFSHFNGIYFQLTNVDALYDYDHRERGYCRLEVAKSQMTMLIDNPLPEGQYWIYISRTEDNRPTKSLPIAQSYVDIFLSGCLEIENRYQLHSYAKDCLYLTSYWRSPWVNDREVPLTGLEPIENRNQVDDLLKFLN